MPTLIGVNGGRRTGSDFLILLGEPCWRQVMSLTSRENGNAVLVGGWCSPSTCPWPRRQRARGLVRHRHRDRVERVTVTSPGAAGDTGRRPGTGTSEGTAGRRTGDKTDDGSRDYRRATGSRKRGQAELAGGTYSALPARSAGHRARPRQPTGVHARQPAAPPGTAPSRRCTPAIRQAGVFCAILFA